MQILYLIGCFRWTELTRKIELWVEIHELNEQGEYMPVEVLYKNEVLTGGVLQLRQVGAHCVSVCKDQAVVCAPPETPLHYPCTKPGTLLHFPQLHWSSHITFRIWMGQLKLGCSYVPM